MMQLITYQNLMPLFAYLHAVRTISVDVPLPDDGETGLFEGEARPVELWLAYGGAAVMVSVMSVGILWIT